MAWYIDTEADVQLTNKDLFTTLSLLLSQENMVQFQKMVNQFNTVFNDDFWESVSRLNRLIKGKPGGGGIPIEIWENRDYLYVVALVAGIKDKQNIKIRFRDNSTLILKVKYPLLKPVEDGFMVETEVPGFEEREINLPQPVQSSDYELDLNEGILTLSLAKQSRSED